MNCCNGTDAIIEQSNDEFRFIQNSVALVQDETNKNQIISKFDGLTESPNYGPGSRGDLNKRNTQEFANQRSELSKLKSEGSKLDVVTASTSKNRSSRALVSTFRLFSNTSDPKEFVPVESENELPLRIKEFISLYSSTFPNNPQEVNLDKKNLVTLQNMMDGNSYHGEILDGLPNGWGRFITKKGTVVEGNWERGIISGFVKIFDENGTAYIGGFHNKMKNGFGIFYDKKGLKTKGLWKNNQAEGQITIRLMRTDELIFRGAVYDGMRTGLGYFRDRHFKFTYEGNFINDNFDDEGTKKYDNGKIYRGDFCKGYEHGNGVVHFIDGRMWKGKFALGEPHGVGTLITDLGVEKVICFDRGRMLV